MGLFFNVIILFLLHVHFCCSRNVDVNVSKIHNQKHPIKTNFQFPSPLPSWPQGGGFGSGTIDLGGLQVSQVSNLKKVWAIHEGGPDNQGATFFEPSSIPDGFFMLGSYSQPNNKPFFGWVLAAKDLSPNQDILKSPTDYSLVWSSESQKINQEGEGYIWLPIPPEGYKAVGLVITKTPEKPSLDKFRCVRADFTDAHVHDQWIWGSSNGLNVHNSKPSDPEAQGFSAKTFIATLDSGATVPDACLKNFAPNPSNSMPDLNQIQALVQQYSPRFYFHPDEAFFPSTVNWLFENGALLYSNSGQGPVPISADGANLPQGGSNDGAFWLDLPTDGAARDRVKQGDLQDAGVYIHAKPALGTTHTDLAIWVFYPFNGAGKAKVSFIDVGLGKIGEHVGDWEHVTLRINNFNGALESVFFSQHAGGTWVDAPNLEYLDGNKVVVYSSLHGHAAYPNGGDHLQGGGIVKIRNDAGKGDRFLDTSVRYTVISAGYLGSVVVEPPWLNYAREWGPKIDYNLDDEVSKVKKMLPWLLKKAFEKAVKGIPKEMLYEEGPTGPKWKGSWDGDESTNADLGPYF